MQKISLQNWRPLLFNVQKDLHSLPRTMANSSPKLSTEKSIKKNDKYMRGFPEHATSFTAGRRTSSRDMKIPSMPLSAFSSTLTWSEIAAKEGPGLHHKKPCLQR